MQVIIIAASFTDFHSHEENIIRYSYLQEPIAQREQSIQLHQKALTMGNTFSIAIKRVQNLSVHCSQRIGSKWFWVHEIFCNARPIRTSMGMKWIGGITFNRGQMKSKRP